MKIGFVSLGCPKNLVDSEVMLGMAEQDGHEITADASQADVLVVNTCAFIDRAKQESIDTILEMAELKKQAAGRKLVVTGCLAERYRDELKKEIPEIDAISAPAKSRGSSQFMTGAVGNRSRCTRHARRPCRSTRSLRSSASTCRPTSTTPTRRASASRRGHYAYVKIAEGCDYKCAFCIIPKMRGHYRSRPIDSIVQEARQLAAQGVKELLLISQDTTFYGIDRGERGALPKLLRALNEVDGHRVDPAALSLPDDDHRATSSTPSPSSTRSCKYIDLPLQHASDRGAEAHEAARHAQVVRAPAREHPRAHSQRRPAHDLHRRLPRRDGGGLRGARGVHRGDRLRPRRRVHLLARGRHLGARARRTMCRRRRRRSARSG